jgi:lysozyme
MKVVTGVVYPTLEISSQGIELIKAWEGCRLKTYLCSAGVPTIGYGHTKGVKLGDVITQQQADDFLREDIYPVVRAVNKLAPGLKQCQFDALCSFAFNVGTGALGKSTLLKVIKAGGSDSEIELQFLRWNKAAGKPVLGLTRRRQEEAHHYKGVLFQANTTETLRSNRVIV